MHPISKQKHEDSPLSSSSNKNLILLVGILIFLIWLVNILGFSFTLKSSLENLQIKFTRTAYGISLIIAGLISDKNRSWGAILGLAALAFPFAALALGNTFVGKTIMWMFAYLFLGFLAVHRILVFVDISAKWLFPSLSTFDLMAGRLGESAGTFATSFITGIPLILIAAIILFLIIILFLPLYQKLYPYIEDMEKQKFTKYIVSAGLSPREQAIFALILQGMTNAEIATLLYISENTVKFHVGNIFKRLALLTD